MAQELIDVVTSARLTELVVERLRDHVIDAEITQQGSALFGRRKIVTPLQPFDDQVGMREKGQRDRQFTLGTRFLNQPTDQILMPAMDAIEHPDRDDGWAFQMGV